MNLKPHTTVIASAWVLASAAASAQINIGKPMGDAHPAVMPKSTATGQVDPKRDHNAAVNDEKDALEQKLQAGNKRADYGRILQSNGYRIAAVNADKNDYLEYEVVKGSRSYEVQLDFEGVTTKASNIDVTTNMWRADATKRMMEDSNYRLQGAPVADPEGHYSDRRYMKAWTDEKERLERALPLNLQVADYKSKIEQLGYKFTAVNEREKDYVEYEIAQGDNSYEVQIDLDPKTQRAKEIDVTSNLWEADPTDAATDRK